MMTPKTKGLVKDQFLVSSSGDKTVKMWNVAGNECVREFLGHGKKLVTKDTIKV